MEQSSSNPARKRTAQKGAALSSALAVCCQISRPTAMDRVPQFVKLMRHAHL